MVKVVISLLLAIGLLAVAGCSGSALDGRPASAATGSPVASPPNSSDSSVPQAEVTKPPEKETTKPSQKVTPSVVKIGSILETPGSYAGKAVVVEGKIISECGAGCWFTLRDDSGTIYIDLAPKGLVIPQKRGASARVYGEVVTKGSDVYLLGSKVEFL